MSDTKKEYKKGHYTLVFSDGEKPDLEVAYNMTDNEVRTVFRCLSESAIKEAYLYYQTGEGDKRILMTENEVRGLLSKAKRSCWVFCDISQTNKQTKQEKRR